MSIQEVRSRFFGLGAAALLMLAAGSAQAQAPKRIAVMAFDDFYSSDVTAPLEVFGKAIASGVLPGYEVITVAPQAGPVRSNEGITIVADYGLQDAPEIDVLIVGSRGDVDSLLEDPAFMAFIEERGSRATWLASNCAGAFLLGGAGLLDGKKATTYHGGESRLQEEYPEILVQEGSSLVVDGNTVTSHGSLVSYEASLELLRLMSGDAVAEDVAESIAYTRLIRRSMDPRREPG